MSLHFSAYDVLEIHGLDERIEQRTDASEGSVDAAFRLLQLLPRVTVGQEDACHGVWNH
jgi:hypothetical protein